MTDTEIHPRSFLATATREQLVAHILNREAEAKRAAERHREVLRERDRARDDRQAALDLAEQYARKAGIDVEQDDLLRGITTYWEVFARGDKAVQLAEAQRWDVQVFAKKLVDWVAEGRLAHLTGDQVAVKVGERIGELFSAQGRATGRSRELFARPAAPTPQSSLYDSVTDSA